MRRVISRPTCKLLVLCSSLKFRLSTSAAVQHFDIPGIVRVRRQAKLWWDVFVKVVQNAGSRRYRVVALFAFVDSIRYHTSLVQL